MSHSISSNHSLSNDDETTTVIDEQYNDYYDDESLSSSIQRALKRAAIPEDTGKRRIYRSVPNGRGGSKIVKIEFYETNSSPGKYIRDAITGNKCVPFRVGSKDEDLFFSVSFVTGELGQEPCVLFFDSPEQYERLFGISISQEAKERWLEKVTYARLEYNRRVKKSGNVKVK